MKLAFMQKKIEHAFHFLYHISSPITITYNHACIWCTRFVQLQCWK